MQKSNDASSGLMQNLLANKTVLIVDDDEDYAEALEEVFNMHTCNVICMNDPKCAMKYALGHDFDLLIVDKNMPWMDGIEFSKKIREEKPSSNIILITAYPNEESRKQCLEIGVRYYLAKPFRKNDILEIVTFLFL